jgi:hypothetical protein
MVNLASPRRGSIPSPPARPESINLELIRVVLTLLQVAVQGIHVVAHAQDLADRSWNCKTSTSLISSRMSALSCCAVRSS